jgi:hypothetical protein
MSNKKSKPAFPKGDICLGFMITGRTLNREVRIDPQPIDKAVKEMEKILSEKYGVDAAALIREKE